SEDSAPYPKRRGPVPGGSRYSRSLGVTSVILISVNTVSSSPLPAPGMLPDSSRRYGQFAAAPASSDVLAGSLAGPPRCCPLTRLEPASVRNTEVFSTLRMVGVNSWVQRVRSTSLAHPPDPERTLRTRQLPAFAGRVPLRLVVAHSAAAGLSATT